MSYKMYIEPKMVELAKEFGFKYLKSKREGFKKNKEVGLRFILMNGTLGVSIGLYIENILITDFVEKIAERDYTVKGRLIRILLDNAFSSDLDLTYMGQIELSYKTYDVAPVKFEKLFREFVIPWFEKNGSYKGIRRTIRDNAATGALWKPVFNNKEITSYFHWDKFAIGFYHDVVLSKILNDTPASANDIYEQYWAQPIIDFLDTWDEKDQKYYKDYPDIIKAKDQIPVVIEKLESITDEEWEKFR
ncbi:hypothetical protein [Plebeiibacterium sediminum]|uniref:Uncharacterized protein n=1 Tax=Plebeiibacterium sediminum TaxID=2992112 RepID=A0AAE3M8F5_9BACT|nr:hypothetical protein [Plebeiobacterium sediminum]MCW3788485.1 hypothetical protein [Plebeiobacterium sediminum]